MLKATANTSDMQNAGIDTLGLSAFRWGRRLSVWLWAVWLMSGACGLEGAEVAWREAFDSPQTSWSLRQPSEGRIHAQSRERVLDDGQEVTFESLSISGPAGYSTYIEHALPPAPLIDELEFEVRVRSLRPGVRIGVEVACPRAADSEDSDPPRLLVMGDRYTHPGVWQVLRLGALRQATRRHARLQKTPSGQPFDLREAYIDRVVVLVPGGPKPSSIEIDDLVVKGVVFGQAAEQIQPASHETPAEEGPLLEGPLMESVLHPKSPTVGITPVYVARQGDAIAVEGGAFLPRIVTHRGEPLATLAELGFNTIWLDHVPTAEERSQAHRARLWLIAPPPPPAELEKIRKESDWQTVLAWSLGREKLAIDIDATRSEAEAIRHADRSLLRPLLVEARDRRRTFGQLADILVDPLCVAGPMESRAAGEVQHRLLGCVSWVSIETQLSPLARTQAATFAPHRPDLGYYPPLTLRELALEAVAAGSRGVVIRTGEPLTGKQGPLRSLMTQLDLLHRELALLEPWLLGGKPVAGAVVDHRQEVPVRSWQLERARMVLVPPHALPIPASTPSVTLTVAGVADTASAYLVTPAGLVQLEVRRVAGGLRVITGDLSGGALVLLTDDLRAVGQLKQHTSNHAERCAKGERDLAMGELTTLDENVQNIAQNQGSLANVLETTKAALQQCDLLLASRDYPRAFQLARNLRYSLHGYVQSAPKTLVSSSYDLESWPLRPTPAAWSNYLALRHAVDSLPRGPNLLPAGDFEQLGTVRSAGWTHLNYASPAWKTSVELPAESPKHGAAFLRLSAAPIPGQLSDVADGQALVWVTSPQIQFPRGATVEITGWARVPKSGRGRLVVADSLGGDELALRIGATRDWQAFRAIRAVDASGRLSLQLALDGPGQVDVDAVMIRQVLPPKQAGSTTAAAPVGTRPH